MGRYGASGLSLEDWSLGGASGRAMGDRHGPQNREQDTLGAARHDGDGLDREPRHDHRARSGTRHPGGSGIGPQDARTLMLAIGWVVTVLLVSAAAVRVATHEPASAQTWQAEVRR